jgi:tRNA-splicing ligase RtcB
MSYKYEAVKHSDNHYVLGRIGNMRTDVHAFLSDELYASSEEGMWEQIVAGASYEGVIGAYLMPDTHVGFGVPVGSVVVTEDTIIQACSGYDISCGVVHLKVPLHARDIQSWDVRKRWVKAVEGRVSTGYGVGRPRGARPFERKDLDDVLRHGALALGIDPNLCERGFIPLAPDTDLSKLVDLHGERATDQLGSVGGGNHFVEMQCEEHDGQVWVMIHCGSRGYGYKVADHFFRAGAELRGLPSNRREDSWLHMDEAMGKEYWNFHNSAANYAIANRHVIVGGIQDALGEVFGVKGEVFYEISHNVVQQETLVLPDGTMRKGFVHRKGATRAFPAGHPDLVGSKWEGTGHPCLVPGSMFTGAAILYPLAGAYKSACSVNHGSGRVMARGKAKRELGPIQALIDEEMLTVKRTFDGVDVVGIVGNYEHTPLDECAHVYKDLDAVLGVLEGANIARVAHRLYPVCSIKGTES